MKELRKHRHLGWIAVFWIAGAAVATAQIDFSGMVNGVVGEVQNTLNEAFGQSRTRPTARPQGDRDMGHRTGGNSAADDYDYAPSYAVPSYGGYGASAAVPARGAPQPIAGQDNAFSLDFGGSAAPTTSRAAAPAQGGETVTVMGRGMGTNREEALKDAYRDAIERAVGLYVDAEQMMKNEKLVQDQILTHSNAYIERYDIKKEETRPNGLTEIQILAVVNRSALTKKLSEVMPSQTFQIGSTLQNLHAQSVTTQKRGEDAEALLENVLKDANPITQLMKVSLSPVKPQIRKAYIHGGDKNLMYLRFNVSVDEQKYFGEFLPSLLAVFDQIALERPKTVLLQARFENDAEDDEKMEYLQGKYEEYIGSGDPGNNTNTQNYSNRDGAPVGEVMLGNADYDMTSGLSGSDVYWLEHLEEQGCVHVVVIVKMNAARSVVQARHYRLPVECGKAFKEWEQRIIGSSGYDSNTTIYNVMFTDRTGELLAAYPITFENAVLCNFELGSSYQLFGTKQHHSDDIQGVYLTPMVSMKAKARERWVGFDIPREELPNIQSVKIELAE
jgi:hypothetical protein